MPPPIKTIKVPKTVSKTIFPVFASRGGGGGRYEAVVLVRADCSFIFCVVGITMRGWEFCSTFATVGAGTFGFDELRRMTVISSESFSTLSLGSSVKFGWASSRSGVPSLVQKRKISSS